MTKILVIFFIFTFCQSSSAETNFDGFVNTLKESRKLKLTIDFPKYLFLTLIIVHHYFLINLIDHVAQWIAYQTSDLGVAGSSPVVVKHGTLSFCQTKQHCMICIDLTVKCINNYFLLFLLPQLMDFLDEHFGFSKKKI